MPIDKRYISVEFSEPQLRERNRPLAALLEMSDLLSGARVMEKVWEEALSKILEWFGLSAGRIYLLDEAGEYLNLVAFKGLDAGGLEKIRVSEGFSGKAVRTKSFIAQPVSELENGKRADLLSKKGLKIVICVPLMAMGQVLGVMNLAADKAMEFDHASIDLLIALGNQLAAAANNARLYEELESKVRTLEAQKDAIEFFAYSISHDLKSPAVGIYGLTRRLNENYCEALQETGKHYCEQILKASEQIVRLVDRINAYIMAKESPLRFEDVRIRDVIEGIRAEFSEALSRRKVKWSEPDSMPTIVADRISITRIFRNLVDNALKYGGPDLGEIRIDYREEEKYHVLCVYDDGVALKPENAEALFLVFQRYKTSHGIEGTGLGLATVKEIAERHHGKVWMESGQEKGTTFFLSISKEIEKKKG